MEKFIVKITQINKNLNFRKSDETNKRKKISSSKQHHAARYIQNS